MNRQSVRVFHPFKPFVPEGAASLLLGSFPGGHSTCSTPPVDHWYYTAPRNQFWPIMKRLFPGRELATRSGKMQLFSDLRMAVTDVILSCERKKNSNQDRNLIHRVYNREAVERIITRNPVERILFTGKGVRREFEKHFSCPDTVALIDLPSPSPAYFRMSLAGKADAWQAVFITCGLLPDE